MHFHPRLLLPILGLHVLCIGTLPLEFSEVASDVPRVDTSSSLRTSPDLLAQGDRPSEHQGDEIQEIETGPIESSNEGANPDMSPSNEPASIVPGETRNVLEVKEKKQVSSLLSKSPLRFMRAIILRNSAIIRHQWFKYTIGAENDILRDLEVLQKKLPKRGADTDNLIPELIEKISSIQLIRTHLSDQYRVAGMSDEIRKLAKDALVLYTKDLRVFLQRSPKDEKMELAQFTQLGRLFQRIIETEDLKLEIRPELRSNPTISQLKTSRLLPPSRDDRATMMKEWRRSKKGIQWATYLADYDGKVKNLMGNVPWSTTDMDMANEIADAMKDDVEAGKHLLKTADYETYLESTHRNLRTMKRSTVYLQEQEYNSDAPFYQACQHYFKFKGIQMGPITFNHLNAFPDTLNGVKEALTSVDPPTKIDLDVGITRLDSSDPD